MSSIIILSSTGQSFTYTGISTIAYPFIDFPSLINIVSVTVPSGYAIFVTDFADVRAMQTTAGSLNCTPSITPSSQIQLVIVKIGAQLTIQGVGSDGNITSTTAFLVPSDITGSISFATWLSPQSYVLGSNWNGVDSLKVTSIGSIVAPNALSLVLANNTISTLTSADVGNTNLGVIKVMFFNADAFINNMYVFPGGDSWPIVTLTPVQSGRTSLVQTMTSQLVGRTSTNTINLDSNLGITIAANAVNVNNGLLVGEVVSCPIFEVSSANASYRFLVGVDNLLWLEKQVGNVVTVVSMAG